MVDYKSTERQIATEELELHKGWAGGAITVIDAMAEMQEVPAAALGAIAKQLSFKRGMWGMELTAPEMGQISKAITAALNAESRAKYRPDIRKPILTPPARKESRRDISNRRKREQAERELADIRKREADDAAMDARITELERMVGILDTRSEGAYESCLDIYTRLEALEAIQN